MGDNTWGPDPRAGLGSGDAGETRPVDLSALRGSGAEATAAARWEALAARIEAAGAPELARRAAERGIVVDLVPFLAGRCARRSPPPQRSRWSSGPVWRVRRRLRGRATVAPRSGRVVSSSPPAQVAQALRVDDAEAAWLARGAAPSHEALAEAVGLRVAEPAP
jgi:hypothetical protein